MWQGKNGRDKCAEAIILGLWVPRTALAECRDKKDNVMSTAIAVFLAVWIQRQDGV